MSTSNIVEIYHDAFGRLPDSPNQLIVFSQQFKHLQPLSWSEARDIIKSISPTTHSKKRGSLKHRSCAPSNTVCTNTTLYDNLEPSMEQEEFIYSSPMITPSISESELELSSLPNQNSSADSFPFNQRILSLPKFAQTSGQTQPERIMIQMFNDKHHTQLITSPQGEEEEETDSTILSVPEGSNPNLQHQTETISEVSIYDNIHSLDPQDVHHQSYYNDDDHLPMISTNCSNDSGCPIYHDDEAIYGNKISEAETNVFESLQCKLFEMKQFNETYMDLKSKYAAKQNKLERERRINLNRTKQNISEYFGELQLLLRESENALYSELNELYKAQTKKNEQRAMNERNDDDKLQNMATQHVHYLSQNVNRYESIANTQGFVYIVHIAKSVSVTVYDKQMQTNAEGIFCRLMMQ